MTKRMQLALKQLHQAVSNLREDATDNAAYPDEKTREIVRRACMLTWQLAMALENGPVYPTTGRAQEFDHVHQNKVE